MAMFRCIICLQNGEVRDFPGVGHIKSHLGASQVHNMGPFVCMHPGCTIRANRGDRISKHRDGNGEHDALWAEDAVLRANITAQAQACLLPAPAPAPAAPSQQQGADSSDDDDEDDTAPEAGSFDEQPFGEGPGGNTNLAIKVNGIPLREEIFEVLFEVIEAELAACGEGELCSRLENLEASLQVLRQACLVNELLTLVKGLAKIVKSQKTVNTLVVVYQEIGKTFGL